MPMTAYNTPVSEDELLSRCQAIEGYTLSQLAFKLGLTLPSLALRRKGWIGMAIERALGCTAGNQAQPDFLSLGIELKTIPLTASGAPAESTFVTSIPLLTLHQQQWHTSSCYAKLKRVLWVPVESDKALAFAQRRIGKAFLWSPNAEQEAILKADWQELTTLILTGQLDMLHAGLGEYLQVRPKAAHGGVLCPALDGDGNKIMTLPRGFYLRSAFTRTLYRASHI